MITTINEIETTSATGKRQQQAEISSLSPIEEIIADAKAGRMCIIVDDEDRENEGDLVIPAAKCSAEAVNFMARHGRGLICLALDSAQVKKLGLPPMARHNTSRHQTAFTVSIEAREGVTTGISAADRAHTIRTAIDENSGAADIAMPGHVFPLEARDGGVLVRAGHTEAAVDIARLAGLSPAGVICEIMKDDGNMARLPDLLEFARRHDLKIGSIADLIAYRRRYERLVEPILDTEMHSRYGGSWRMIIYVSKIGYAEHIALVKGDIADSKQPVRVRMHALDVLHDVLGDSYADRGGELQASMEQIAQAGRGVVVLIREPRKTAVSDRVRDRIGGKSPGSGNLRDYGIGAQILLDLGVRDMILLSNSQRPVVGLEGYNLTIAGYEAIATSGTDTDKP